MKVLYLLISLAILVSSCVTVQKPEEFDYLYTGKIKEGEKHLSTYVRQNRWDENALFELGILQVVSAFEEGARSLYHFGPRQELSFFNIPVPSRAGGGTKVTYSDIRFLFNRFYQNLEKAEKTLSQIEGEVKIRLYPGLVKVDINGDGVSEKWETGWSILREFRQTDRVNEEEAKNYVIAFDRGDVYWLRGYVHLIMSMMDVLLAYEWEYQWDYLGGEFFHDAYPGYDFLEDAPRLDKLLKFRQINKHRIKSFLNHQQMVINTSRSTWKAILDETDDEDEWIPSPTQTRRFQTLVVSPERILAWQQFLTTIEGILKGKKLVPLPYRTARKFGEGYGFNYKKLVEGTGDLNIIVWLNQTPLAEYTEKGDVVTREDWDLLQEIFEENFIRYALWFN